LKLIFISLLYLKKKNSTYSMLAFIQMSLKFG
jgi:hypothetical protein